MGSADDPRGRDLVLAARPGRRRCRRSAARPRASDLDVDVAIVGAGFTGPVDRDRADRHGPGAARRRSSRRRPWRFGASGRNGGFCEASLTHGLANGIRHFPDELERLEREGIDNLAGPHRVHPRPRHRLRPRGDRHARAGRPGLPGRRVPGVGRRGGRARRAPRVPGPGRRPGRGPLPALAGRAVPAAGAGRPARPGEAVPWHRPGRARARRARPRGHAGHRPASGGPAAWTSRPRRAPTVRAGHVVVATSAYSGWLRRLSPLFVPVYDYVLVSEPLTPDAARVDRLGAAPGPVRRQQPVPLLPADRRRPDPVGRLRRHPLPRQPGRTRRSTGGRRRSTSSRPSSSGPSRSSTGSRFPYRWGGAIDTTSRFTVTFGQTMGGRVTYALGYTGLGVGAQPLGRRRRARLHPATRRGSAAAAHRGVSPPIPFPPEPLRSVDGRHWSATSSTAPTATRAGAGVILQTLDALGIGFDS